MDGARWELIQSLFHEAVALPGTERQAFLESVCGDDEDLLNELCAMLAADRRNTSLLDRGLPDVAYRLVGTSFEPGSAEEFGPYRLQRLLGEGGMGVVWLAERIDAGNLVAIKFLPHAGLSPARRERFAREIKTLAKLKHPLIARLYDAGTLPDGTPWFVMEYVEGVRLTEYLSKTRLTIRQRLQLFRSVCEAVQYAHSQEIIHRDLKPSNILVEGDGTPRLLDFGIARELQTTDGPADQTRRGLRFMSPDYAAPEWVKDGTVGFYTDVYSLGIILYEMLAGQFPFERSQSMSDESFRSAVRSAPERPSALARRPAEALPDSIRMPSISKDEWKELDVLCLKAMHPDAKERYQSVEALIRDIEHYLKEEPLEARPDTLHYRAAKFVRRNRYACFATLIACVLIAGMVLFFTLRLAKARNAALAEAARTQRIQHFMLSLLGAADVKAAPSSDLRVTTLLDRGIKEAASLNSDPEVQGEMYENLGNMYDMLGEFPKSNQLLLLALDKTKSALGPDNVRVADTLVQIGILRGDQSQFKEARQYVQAGVDIASRHLPPDDPRLMGANSALGRIVAQSGSYEEAIAVLEPIVQHKPTTEEEEYTLSESVSSLAVAQYSVGHYDAAEALNHRSIALDSKLFGEKHPQMAFDLVNLGLNKSARSQYSEAEPLYRKGVEILQGWYGPDHPDTAMVMGLLARTLLFEGKYDEAGHILGEVLKIQEQAYGSTDGRIAVTLDSLGRIAVRHGDLTDAQSDFSRAVEIDRTLYGDTSYQTAVISADLGDVYTREGEYKQAEPILSGALKVLIAYFPAGDPHIGLAEARWGHLLLAVKRYAEAEKQLASAYQVMEQQPTPQLAEIQNLRHDLAAVYAALNQPENARKFRAELTGVEESQPKATGDH